MPFYLHHSALQKLQRQIRPKFQTVNGGWLERKRSETLRGSRLSLRKRIRTTTTSTKRYHLI